MQHYSRERYAAYPSQRGHPSIARQFWHIPACFVFMLQSLALPTPGFIPICVNKRPSIKGYTHADGGSSKTWVCGLRALRCSRFLGDGVARRLQFSTFTARKRLESNATRDERMQRFRGDAPQVRQVIHASQWKHSRPLTRTKRKVFLVDFRWIISAACKDIHPATANEPRLMRKCASVLFSLLKTHTEREAVAVVLPNQKELNHLISQANLRTRPRIKRKRVVLSSYFIPTLNQICRALGVSVYVDKLHGSRETIARLTGSQHEIGVLVVLVSSDSDFLQLLRRGKVTILKRDNGGSFEEISEELFVKAMHGLHPSQYVDLLALIGRKDERIGIPEIKREFASLLVSRFGSIEGLVAVAKDVLEAEQAPYRSKSRKILRSETREFISPRIARILLRRKKHLLAAKQLLSLTQDSNYRVKLTSLQRKPVNASRVTEVLHSFDKYYKKKVSHDPTKATAPVLNKQERIVDKSEPISISRSKDTALFGKQSSRHALSITVAPASVNEGSKLVDATDDLGTAKDDLDVLIPKTGSGWGILPIFELNQNVRILTGVACGNSSGKALYVDLRSSQLPKRLVDALESKSVEKHGCYLRELYKHLVVEHNITMDGILFDAHIALDLLGAGGKRIRGMIAAHADSSKPDLYDLLFNQERSILESSGKRAVSLCGALSRITTDLRFELERKGLLPLALRIEFPLIPVLGCMEIRGVPIVSSELERLRTSSETRLSEIEDEIRNLRAARAVNSPTRIVSSEALFDACFGRQRMSSATPSYVAKAPASRWELETMASDSSLPQDHRTLADLFLQKEEISKFLERDVGPLSRHIQSDGRIRATFVQGDSVTGRLATRDPNLQTIPVRSRLGQELRSTFRATPGMQMVCADYSQIELRIVASLCGDPFMLDAFSSGTDIHRCIAAKIFDVPITDVSHIQRNQAKQVTYSILYGVSSTGLSEQLGVSCREAENMLSEFRIDFPAVQELTTNLVNEAARAGYAKTLLGRRLPLPMLARGNPAQRRAASRRAVNMPIQGTQADMIKLSMVRIHERLQAIEATSSLVLQVHDELILEIADNELEEVVSLVEEEMISALPLTGVDISVRVSCGPSWCKND